ncbi:hypothetical protein ACVW1A_003008 [Bradyrhizobium sp. LB1.3]
MQLGLTDERDTAAVLALLRRADLGAKVLQHQLGMVAAGLGLDDRGGARRGQAREQHGGFDLGRGDRGLVGDRQRIARALDGQRQTAALATGGDLRAHLFQWVQDPAHGPAAQRGIAVEHRRDRAAGDGAHDQPAAGAGVAEIQRRLGLGEARNTHAVHRPGEITYALDPSAERFHGFCGVEDVLALEEARDPGLSNRERAQDEGTVGDRLVPRHPYFSGQGAAGARLKRRRLVGMGQDCVLGCALWARGQVPHGLSAVTGMSFSRNALLTAARQLAK